MSLGMWSCGGSGILRYFLPELPPPTRGMDAARTQLDSLIVFFCYSLCIIFFVVPWCGNRCLVYEWVWETTLIGKVDCFSLLASLASGGVMRWLGSSVAGRECGDFVDFARLLETMGASGRLEFTIRSCPIVLLMFWSC